MFHYVFCSSFWRLQDLSMNMDGKRYTFQLNFDVYQRSDLSKDVDSHLHSHSTGQLSLLLRTLKVMMPMVARLHLQHLGRFVFGQIRYVLCSSRKMACNRTKGCILWYLLLNLMIINCSIPMKWSKTIGLRHPIYHFACHGLNIKRNTQRAERFNSDKVIKDKQRCGIMRSV